MGFPERRKVEITKKQLTEWRAKNYSYERMAKEAGMSESSIFVYLKKYGMTSRKKVSGEDIKQFIEMHQDGYPIKRIAELTGFAYSTVNRILRETEPEQTEEPEGTCESMMFIPQFLTYAEEKKPKITKLVTKEGNWLDVSDLWIPR